LYRGINDCKKGYKSRTDVVKDEKGDLFVDSNCIVDMWRNFIPQLLNVHGLVMLGRQKHTEEPLVPEPSAFEVELAIEKIKSHKSAGND